MDPEGFVLGPRAKRAISLVAAALTVIVAGGLLFIHPPSTSSARFVGVPPPPTLSHAYAAHFDFVDSQHGWASVQRFGTTAITTIYRTGDGAHSWRPVFRLHAAEQVQSLHFWDRTNGIVEADHVYTTSDAGAHWKSSWWASSHGLLYRTTDAGNTWKSIETVLPPVLDNMDPGAIHMVDANFGWAAATSPGGTSLLASSDGGHNWKLVNVPQPA